MTIFQQSIFVENHYVLNTDKLRLIIHLFFPVIINLKTRDVL